MTKLKLFVENFFIAFLAVGGGICSLMAVAALVSVSPILGFLLLAIIVSATIAALVTLS